MRIHALFSLTLLVAGCPTNTSNPDDILEPCFVAGTAVSTPDGATAIEQLKVGDVVLSYDHNKGKVVEGKVTHTFAHGAKPTLRLTAPGVSLGVTPNHPIFSPTKDAYVAAGSVAAGDSLLRRQAGRATTSTWTSSTPAATVDVFNITVEPHHNYFAGDVLAHNKSPEPPNEWCVNEFNEVAEQALASLPPDAMDCTVDDDCARWPQVSCSESVSICFDIVVVGRAHLAAAADAVTSAPSFSSYCTEVENGCEIGLCFDDDGEAYCEAGICAFRWRLEDDIDISDAGQ